MEACMDDINSKVAGCFMEPIMSMPGMAAARYFSGAPVTLPIGCGFIWYWARNYAPPASNALPALPAGAAQSNPRDVLRITKVAAD